jgi:hypothetical protein
MGFAAADPGVSSDGDGKPLGLREGLLPEIDDRVVEQQDRSPDKA